MCETFRTLSSKICDAGKFISFSGDARGTALAYMAAKWNVKSQRLDRVSGDMVYTLAGGQTMRVGKEKNVFERPLINGRMLKTETLKEGVK